ncbi:hypothetical protein Q8A67_017642 [Cirrhinus molitorella]|uniref:Uncharacterized protein n=1 Tax=Cirrhinus molitorella TaxID=172907 RepID=A0AA88TK51_9TELE|nr:hypothetical protein Q8A67_017642 [Cirrhinus molitorella]
MRESAERNGGVRVRQVHLTECTLVPMVAGPVRCVASQNDDSSSSPRALPPPKQREAFTLRNKQIPELQRTSGY